MVVQIVEDVSFLFNVPFQRLLDFPPIQDSYPYYRAQQQG
jgi:hypothetical protein